MLKSMLCTKITFYERKFDASFVFDDEILTDIDYGQCSQNHCSLFQFYFKESINTLLLLCLVIF